MKQKSANKALFLRAKTAAWLRFSYLRSRLESLGFGFLLRLNKIATLPITCTSVLFDEAVNSLIACSRKARSFELSFNLISSCCSSARSNSSSKLSLIPLSPTIMTGLRLWAIARSCFFSAALSVVMKMSYINSDASVTLSCAKPKPII